MTNPTPTNILDDRAWIREVRDRAYEETKDMTIEERLEYDRRGAAEFDKHMQRIREQKKKTVS